MFDSKAAMFQLDSEKLVLQATDAIVTLHLCEDDEDVLNEVCIHPSSMQIDSGHTRFSSSPLIIKKNSSHLAVTQAGWALST
jgi:hypothetical protein